MVEDMYKEEFGDSEADKREELKESVTSTVTDGGYLGKYSDSKADHSCNAKDNGYAARLGFKNGSQRDDSIDGGVMTLHGDNWPNVDDNYISPQKFIKPNQTSEGSLKAIAAPYDISVFGDFAVGNQVSNFALQCWDKDCIHLSGGT